MRYLLLTISLVAVLLASSFAALSATDISGTWQGTMNGPAGQLRRIMQISKAKGGYSVVVYSIDESDVPIVANHVMVHGSDVAMRFDMNTEPWNDYHRAYYGTLGKNGTSIVGLWGILGGPALPITFHKVARASWTIIEPKPHLVPVDTNVKDEVLDWGGNGRPVMLLAGLGNTGHVWYNLIPALTAKYHVYSVTRRGFGNSSKPGATIANYSVDRLGDDVVAVMDAMKIQKPVLIGHAMAGEELSDVGTRYPQKIAGLIYLEAGYWYAFRSKVSTPRPLGTPQPGERAMPAIGKAIYQGANRPFTAPMNVPILAVYADPHDLRGFANPADLPVATAQDKKDTDAIATAFAHGQPKSKVVRIANASEYVFISNQDEVLHEINAFIAALPQNS